MLLSLFFGTACNFFHIAGKMWGMVTLFCAIFVGLSALLKDKGILIIVCLWHTNTCYVLFYVILDINKYCLDLL